ncbi:hypothetical protein HK097_010850, partial [Rhizophlyctis rosea]
MSASTSTHVDDITTVPSQSTNLESSIHNLIDEMYTPTAETDRETSPAPSTPTSIHTPHPLSDGEELVATGTSDDLGHKHKKAARPVSAFKRAFGLGKAKTEDRRKSLNGGVEMGRQKSDEAKRTASVHVVPSTPKDVQPVIVRASTVKTDNKEKSPYRLTFSKKPHPSPPSTPTEEEKKPAARPPSPANRAATLRKTESPEPKKTPVRKPSGTVTTGVVAAHAVTKKPSRPSSVSSSSGVIGGQVAKKRNSVSGASVEKEEDEDVKRLKEENDKLKEENQSLRKQIETLTASLAAASTPTTYTHVATPYPTETIDRAPPSPGSAPGQPKPP